VSSRGIKIDNEKEGGTLCPSKNMEYQSKESISKKKNKGNW